MKSAKTAHATLILGLMIAGAQRLAAQECSGPPSQCGEWGPLVPMKLTEPGNFPSAMQVVHAILLRTGKVLCIDQDNLAHSAIPDIVLFDPSDGRIDLVLDGFATHYVFCSGHAALPDGRILFSGGGLQQLRGRYQTSIYVPSDTGVGTFEVGPEERWLLNGDPNAETYRWYPTCTTLGDGTILVTDGWVGGCGPDATFGNGNIPVTLEPSSDPPAQWTWRPLYGAEYCVDFVCTQDEFDLTYYPFMFQLINGKVLMAGSHYADASDDCPVGKQTRTLDTASESWSLFPATLPPNAIKGGSAVMFQVNGAYRIMKAGGGLSAQQGSACDQNEVTNRVFTIDPEAPLGAEWIERAAMPHGRLHFYLIALPDGKVLAVGGTSSGPGGAGNLHAGPCRLES